MTDDLNNARHLLAGKPGHVHFVGIGGVGMAALAFQLKHKGWRVSGCDAQTNALTAWLAAAGIDVRRGHDPAHLAGVDWVVRTTAVRADHPEVAAAAARGLPVMQRGVVLAALLSSFGFSIIVSGTHGKTTTTAMITRILRQAGRNPSYCIGGVVPVAPLNEEGRAAGSVTGLSDGVSGAGPGDCLVVEADESDGTLAGYAPDLAVITNVEFDHAEHFPDLASLRACFADMIRQVRRSIIYCADDPEALSLCRNLGQAVSYGFAPAAEWRADIVEETAGAVSFQVRHGGRDMGRIGLSAPGRHNVLDALAACAAASACGVGFDAIRQGLQAFQPVRRRFERVIEKDDVLVISDYAHHPTEIAVTLRTFLNLPRKRRLVVFQPHRYSRTRALAADFAAALTGMDELILAPVYAASEPMLTGGTHWDLYARVRCLGKARAFCAASLDGITGYLRTVLRPGDGLLIMGAGDVEHIAEKVRAELARSGAAALDPALAWSAALEIAPWKSAVFQRQISLADKTTLRVGGRADIFAELADEMDLIRLLRLTYSQHIPFSVLGAGSNILVSDLGLRGVVARLMMPAFRRIRIEKQGRVIAGAGASLHELTCRMVEEGLSGLEFLAGIPGVVGGALRMNAGAWGANIGSRVAWVRFLDPDGSEQVAEAAALGFDYRHCAGLAGKIAIEAAFDLTSADKQTMRTNVAEILKRRAWLRDRSSAGSVFRNPEGDFSGRLLEQAGMKGRRIGGARVLDEHANVIVTEPSALASDVRALMDMMRQAVRASAGIELKEEIVCLE